MFSSPSDIETIAEWDYSPQVKDVPHANREQVVQDRRSGMSLTQVAKKHGISRASVCRLMKEAGTTSDAAVLVSETVLGQQAQVQGD